MTTKPKPTESDRVRALIRANSLTPAHVAAGLGWPLDKTETLLGLRVGGKFVSVGPRRVDRLAAACLCAPVIGATPGDYASAGESDEASTLVEFAAECCKCGVAWRVGDSPPTSHWPELRTHRTERLRRLYRSIGQGFATVGRTGYRAMSRSEARHWEDLADEIGAANAGI